jgi:hypothetical protein
MARENLAGRRRWPGRERQRTPLSHFSLFQGSLPTACNVASGRGSACRRPDMKIGPFACRFPHYTDPIAILGEPFMRALLYLIALVLVLLIGDAASAQEGKDWLGADVLDVAKAEADKLGWDSPRGAELGVVASGSPAEKAGLKSGDIILSIDRTVIDTSSEADVAIGARRPGDAILLQVLSIGKERRISVTLAAPTASG